MISCSMMVDDLDFVCVPISPQEAEPKSIVDSDAVLSVPVALESLQAVAGEEGQVLESMSRVQLLELPLSDPGHRSESPRNVTAQERIGILVTERPNHAPSVSCRAYYAKRYRLGRRTAAVSGVDRGRSS
jgi:hypothetical protein